MLTLVLLLQTYKESVDHLSLFLLLKIYQTSWCYPSGGDDMDLFKFRCIPRPKDFSDFADYFVRKSVLIAISRCNDLKGLTSWPVVRRLLVDALRYNDNSTNPYSDGSYLATVIACLGYSLVLTTSAELQGQMVNTSQEDRQFNEEILVQSVEELDRYMEMDRLVPSYQNVVTIAGLECRIKLTLAYLIPLDIRKFLAYTRCVSLTLPLLARAAADPAFCCCQKGGQLRPRPVGCLRLPPSCLQSDR